MPNTIADATNKYFLSVSSECQNNKNASATHASHGTSNCAICAKCINNDDDASIAAAPNAYVGGSTSNANRYMTSTSTTALNAETSRTEKAENPNTFTRSAIAHIASGGWFPNINRNGTLGSKFPVASTS